MNLVTNSYERSNYLFSLFKIVDGQDANQKRVVVAGDPDVCHVELNWLGTYF